jgi:hypothetical protein
MTEIDWKYVSEAFFYAIKEDNFNWSAHKLKKWALEKGLLEDNRPSPQQMYVIRERFTEQLLKMKDILGDPYVVEVTSPGYLRVVKAENGMFTLGYDERIKAKARTSYGRIEAMVGSVDTTNMPHVKAMAIEMLWKQAKHLHNLIERETEELNSVIADLIRHIGSDGSGS